jgi:tRNA-specific 2-thiouridylase
MCNQEIKFKLFLKAALDDGADLIATGHYARTENGKLFTARDTNKDQTYFLYRVTTEALQRTVFPLGKLTKPEVRRLAVELGLPTAAKPDSQGICFVGEVGIREFLSQYISASPGPILDCATGSVLGTHQGAVFYTSGQRQGLGIGGGGPYFVTGKDMATNTVFVTANPSDLELEADHFTLAQLHWINNPPAAASRYRFRSRHRAELIGGRIDSGGNVTLECPERAITAGQSVVVYDGETVLGGGIIT